MIAIPCIVTCDECGVRKDAQLRRDGVTSGFMALMPGSPLEQLVLPGEETTTWQLSDMGNTLCSSECLRTFEAKQKKGYEERWVKR